jgi:hypothetical protein
VESQRHANLKPWNSIQERGGGNLGYNWAVADRDKTMPKNVDDLRTYNNPKITYENDYRAPQYDPKQMQTNIEHIGKVINKKPDTFKAYQGFEGMGIANGIDKHTSHSVQMLTKEQRETTNVEYYGSRGSGTESHGYIGKGEAGVVHKQQLENNHVLNLTQQNIYPVDKTNYGKDGYVTYQNNRDNDEGYFGAMKGAFVANLVDPIVKSLKHTKKTNFQDNPNPNGFVSGNIKHRQYNENEHLSTTNREMDVEKLGLNHLNVNRGAHSNGYMTSNMSAPTTQKQSLHGEFYGNSLGIARPGMNGELTHGFNEKVLVSNYQLSGNAKTYNTETNYRVVNRELETIKQPVPTRTVGYIPTHEIHPHQFLGESTCMPSDYENLALTYNSPDLLNAFKSNPYVQPLNSVA